MSEILLDANVHAEFDVLRPAALALRTDVRQKYSVALNWRDLSALTSRERLAWKAPMRLESYCDLRDAAVEAAQVQKTCELEILAALEAIDPELVKDGLDLWGGAREDLAHWLTESIPAAGGSTCYELLAAGERARVIQLFNAVRYGICL